MNKVVVFVFFIFLHSFCFSYESLEEGIFIQKNINNDHKGPKIAMATVIIDGEKNFEKIVAFGTKSKEIYAKTHGYDFIIATKKLDTCYGVKPTRELEPAWTKLALISRFLDNYDWIFWTDADSIILNFDVKLESFLDDKYDIIGCSETHKVWYPHTYNQDSRFNTGQIFYKNSEIAKTIILGAWNLHGKKTPCSWDQARINAFIKNNNLYENAKVHPLKDFNINPAKFVLGDFIVHMFGYHTWGGRGWGNLEDIMRTFEIKYGYIVETAEKRLNLDEDIEFFSESISNLKIDSLNEGKEFISKDNIQSYNEDLIILESKNLDEYIKKKGFVRIEGHCCLGNTSQPKYFEDLLIENPQIKLVGETGFNAGHSSEIYLKTRPDISVISFDIMDHKYVRYGKKYIDTLYPYQHKLIEGNSIKTLPDFCKNNSNSTFDLIFIDGGHAYDVVLSDIKNFSNCADSNTILVIDDMSFPQVIKAWKKCVEDGIITTGDLFQSKHKKWAECKYLY